MRSEFSSLIKTSRLAVGLACALLAGGTTSLAQQPKSGKGEAVKAESPKAPEKGAGEKVDISDIENKYWAPKDTDFSVVQNRTYSKEKRYALSLQTGPIINDTYSAGYNYGLAANYFFSERYGVEFDFLKSDLKNSEIVDDLLGFAGGLRPNFGRLDSYYGVGFNFVPFYAKMSIFGKKIVYFDMAITPTLGVTKYDKITIDGPLGSSSISYGIDVSQYFFLERWFAIRADLKNRWFKEDVVQYQSDPGIPTGTKIKTKNQHNTFLLLGVTFFF